MMEYYVIEFWECWGSLILISWLASLIAFWFIVILVIRALLKYLNS